APALAAHQRLLLKRGATPSTVREAMTKLGAILQIAAEYGYVTVNPARTVRNVPAEPREEIDPLAPVELERLVATFKGRDRAIALLGGHLGLRPLEIRQVPWSALDVKARTLTVGRAHTKASARRPRVIALPSATARELRAWQLKSGGRGPEPIVGTMSANALRLWGERCLRPAASKASGNRITDASTYTLRHSHASACHHVRSLTLPAILGRLGHKQAVHFQHYAHIIDAIGEARYSDLDALISAARAQSGVPPLFRKADTESGG
ncbi:MAG: site-specific integrase, partial [Solirubrobacterales bacterium]|nr:site-specific integrase [Solirubrobacterales bacterium]